MGLEEDYKKSTRWLAPLFVAALLVLLAVVAWKGLSG